MPGAGPPGGRQHQRRELFSDAGHEIATSPPPGFVLGAATGPGAGDHRGQLRCAAGPSNLPGPPATNLGGGAGRHRRLSPPRWRPGPSGLPPRRGRSPTCARRVGRPGGSVPARDMLHLADPPAATGAPSPWNGPGTTRARSPGRCWPPGLSPGPDPSRPADRLLPGLLAAAAIMVAARAARRNVVSGAGRWPPGTDPGRAAQRRTGQGVGRNSALFELGKRWR